MANRFSLSWTAGDPLDGGYQDDPGWSDVARMLERLKELAGTLTLEVIDGQKTGADSLKLQLRGDRGRYIVLLGISLGRVQQVLSSRYPEASPVMVSILGDLYDATMVISEFHRVINIFEEFFKTGDVSGPSCLQSWRGSCDGGASSPGV